MIPQTKADLVTAALRKAAIASEATLTEIEPQSLLDGLVDLELMIAEWAGEDLDKPIIDTGFALSFGDIDIDPEQPHGVYPYAINGIILCLAVRALTDYKLEGSGNLISKASAAKAVIVARTKMRKVKSRYRTRTPTGSGNKLPSVLGYRYFRPKCDEDE